MEKYSNGLYPINVFVLDISESNKICKNFYFIDDNDNLTSAKSQDIINMLSGAGACALPLIDKKDKSIGIAFLYDNKEKTTGSTIAHESCHIADYICNYVGINNRTFKDGEPYAYLVTWIYEIIEDGIKKHKIKINKKKKDKKNKDNIKDNIKDK
jgi:hypothetical protein